MTQISRRHLHRALPTSTSTPSPTGPLARRWRDRGGHQRRHQPRHDGPRAALHRDASDSSRSTRGPTARGSSRAALRRHVPQAGEAATSTTRSDWLWEPATGGRYQTLSIPRGADAARRSARRTRARPASSSAATRGGDRQRHRLGAVPRGRVRHAEYRIVVTLNDDGSWSSTRTRCCRCTAAPAFHHTDRSTLKRVEAPKPNPLAEA